LNQAKSVIVIKELSEIVWRILQEVFLIVGAKGSGKTTLIKALFPGLEVDFSEKKPYRLYELPGGLHVAEVCGSPDSLGSLILSKPAWRLRAGLVLVDGATGVRADGRALALAAGAPLRAIVLTKADVSPPEHIEEARTLAARVGFEFFAVSTTKNLGIEKLRGWLAGTIPAVKPAAQPQWRHFRVDVIPIPLPGALDLGGLSGEEAEVMKLCDGRRSAGEIALALGMPYGKVRGVISALRMRGYVQALLIGVVG